jgi:hypothetical protein
MAFVLWRSLSERVTQLGRMCTTKAQILILNDTYAHSNAVLAVVCKCTSVLLLVVTVRLLYMRTDASEPCRKLVNQDVPYMCSSICSLICFLFDLFNIPAEHALSGLRPRYCEVSELSPVHA